jgi:hypothetical protein
VARPGPPPPVAKPDGCRQARLLGGQTIGATFTIDGGVATACPRFLAGMDAAARPTFDAVLKAGQAVLDSGVPYKVVYFPAPFTMPPKKDGHTIPTSYPLQLQGALEVMNDFDGTGTLAEARRHQLGAGDAEWGLVLVPVNTGYLSRYGVEAAALVRDDLRSPRTAAAIGLSVSTPDSIRTSAAFGVPFFGTSLTGEYMRDVLNLWLTQPTNSRNARAMADWIGSEGWRRATIVSDAGDGYRTVDAGDACPEVESAGQRYSPDLAARLRDALAERHPGVTVECRDIGTIVANLHAAGTDTGLCAAAARGGIVSTVRGTQFADVLWALDRCEEDVAILSGESATNLVDRARELLLEKWDPERFTLTYLGYRTGSGDDPLQEHGRQALATGADAAYAVWAAVGAARAEGAWSASDVRAHLGKSGVHVEPPEESGRPDFGFRAGERLARAAKGRPRPVVFCEVRSVAPIKERCQAAKS